MKRNKKKPRKRFFLIDIEQAATAMLMLAIALVFFNWPDKARTDITTTDHAIATENQSTTGSVDNVSIGKDVGMIAPDFAAPVYGSGETFVLSEHRGKTVIVNFWATWCTPCCQELPWFHVIYEKYADRLAVVAIHSDLVTDDVEGYLAGFDYSMPFALDADGSVLRAFGGSTMLPQTVVIDADGVITYNAVGSVTLETLEALIQEAGAF